MKNIEWNKVTWYSKLGAAILFIIILPALCLYIGSEYEIVKQLSSTEKQTTETNIVSNSAMYPKMDKFIDPGFYIIKSGIADVDGDGFPEIVFIEGTFSDNDYTAWINNTDDMSDQGFSNRVSPIEKLIIVRFDKKTKTWTSQVLKEMEDGTSPFPDESDFAIVDLNHDGKDEIYHNIAMDGSGMYHDYGFSAFIDGTMKNIELPDDRDSSQVKNEVATLIKQYNAKNTDQKEEGDEWITPYYSVQSDPYTNDARYLIEDIQITAGKFVHEGVDMNFYYTFDGKGFKLSKVESTPFKDSN